MLENNGETIFRFVEGPIAAQEIVEQLASYSALNSAGAYSIFLGQVRKDEIGNQHVESIEYTANISMAIAQMNIICDELKQTHEVKKVTILHSLGLVNTVELCLMVIVACDHRKESFKAIEHLVERIKKEVPIWGKEILENKTHQWKINKY